MALVFSVFSVFYVCLSTRCFRFNYLVVVSCCFCCSSRDFRFSECLFFAYLQNGGATQTENSIRNSRSTCDNRRRRRSRRWQRRCADVGRGSDCGFIFPH